MNMKTMWVLGLTATAVLAAAGCGGKGSSGLEGVYQTTSKTRSTGACDVLGGAVTIDPPFFRVQDSDAVNGLFVDAYECTDAASCNDTGFPLLFLAEGVGGGKFLSETMSRQGCSATWNGTSIEKTADGMGVTIEEESRSGDFTGADCMGEITEALVRKGRAFDCNYSEVWVGMKVQ